MKRMKTKIAALVAVACGALVVMPMQSALAAHQIGGYAHKCIGSTNSHYDKVYVAVAGVGSDNPRNYYAAASGRVTATPGCHVAGRVAVARVQIDKLALLQRVSSSTTVTRAAVGPLSNGNKTVAGQTGGWHAPCGVVLQASVRFSVRYVDGALATGGLLTGGGFFRC
jgi:hypothetical protein